MKPIKTILLSVAILLLTSFSSQAQDVNTSQRISPRLNSYLYVGGIYECTQSDGGLKLDVGIGCRINKHLYLGANIGGTFPMDGWISYAHDGVYQSNYHYEGVKTFACELYSHITANAKVYVPIERSPVTPLFDIKIGANMDTALQSGLYMSYGVGVDYKRLSALVGYEAISSPDFGVHKIKNGFGHVVFLSVGLRFGK